MIQTEIPDGKGGTEKLDPGDARYWEGPYRYEPFPKMVYRATAGEGFTNPEGKLVRTQQEWDRLGSDWTESPALAQKVTEDRDAEYARLAAQRNALDLRMSALAQAEALEVDRSTDEMLPEIPIAPKRGRPKKILES